ncbi:MULTISPECIES: DUF5719 family protein [unclassified Arthrobacter]|uniref:DUF5719 family protein n=1 Tax=unclassified Arthrobacter TaxID=235627 RepID=UPI0019661DA0|nr:MULTISPECIES: DUF5719 family protein [unclassified Arthrobacter]
MRRGAGIGASLILVGACGALVIGISGLEPTGAAAQFPIPVAEVPAGEYTGVCPGPPRLIASDAALADPEFSPESETARSAVSALVLSSLGSVLPGSDLTALGEQEPLATIASGESGESGEDPVPEAVTDENGLTNRTAGVLADQAVDGVSVLSVQPVGDLPATAGAVLSYRATDGDLGGLALSHCTAPRSDFWIVGASTTVGATAVLNLSNPSGTPATVDLELYGLAGPVEAGGSRGLLIAPGATESIVLAGLAAGQDQLAVRVLSDGGRVTGHIQQSLLRELTPGGVELLQAAAPAASTQVISGVRIQDEDIANEITDQDGYETAAPGLQVVVPGSTDAVVNVRVYGAGGEVELPDGGVITATAGAVTSVALDSIPAGDYTVEVTADVLISAAARVSRGTGAEEPVDFGFAPSGARLGSTQVAVFPAGSRAALTFGAPTGRSEVQLTPVAEDGTLLEEQTVSVAGGTTVTVTAADLGDDVVAVLIAASGDPVYGAQVHQIDSEPGISVTSLPPGSGGQPNVAVNLGY